MNPRPGSPGEPRPNPHYRVDADEFLDRPVSRPIAPRSSAPAPRRSRRGLPWWGGCSLFLLGVIVGMVGLLAAVFLLFGAGTTNRPLTAPANASGTPDIATELSQTYLNSEIARNMQGSPVQILGIASLTGLVLDVRPNQQVLVTARIKTALGEFDVGITEAVSVENGLVVVRSTGQPRLGNNNIPINLTDFVNAINTLEVQPQINKYVTHETVDGRNLKLVGLSTSSGLLTAKFNAQ